MSSRIPRIRHVLVALALVALVAACGGGGEEGANSGKSTGDQKLGIPKGVVLRVGDQSQSQETVLRAAGLLDNLPYKLEFKAFLSGPLLVQGFDAGAIDLGGLGDVPAANAVSAKVPVVALGVTSSPETTSGSKLLARPGITSIAQLKGKKIAFTTGTAQNAFALRALKTAGLTNNDVTQIDVPLQQLGTILDSGDADASVVSIGDVIRYQQEHPDAKVLANGGELKPVSYGYTLVSKKAAADPGVFAAAQDFLKRKIQAGVWARQHPEDYAKAVAKVQHQEVDFALKVFKGQGLNYYHPIDTDVQTALQGVVDLMVSSKALPASFQVGPLFDEKVTAATNKIVAATEQKPSESP